jgi:hypothetical protein
MAVKIFGTQNHKKAYMRIADHFRTRSFSPPRVAIACDRACNLEVRFSLRRGSFVPLRRRPRTTEFAPHL